MKINCKRKADALSELARAFEPRPFVKRQSDVKPIKNPATGEEHRARIALPNGFEYKEAEMGNTVNCHVSAGDKLTFELKNTYAQLNEFDWSN